MTLDPTFHLSTPPSLGWHGSVRLQYDRVQAKTRLASAWYQAPLKVQRPFYPESDSICHTVLIHTAGGMVDGDRLCYQVNLAPEAHAVITTAAASKVYRNPEQGTEQVIELNLEPGAFLEWFPQETILFNAAQFKQTLRVNLAPGARWLGWDIYRFGRTARGERFLEGQWRSHTEVWRGGVPLWIDRQQLPGNAQILDHPHGLNRCSVVGTLAWLGQSVERELIQALRSRWTQANFPGEVGITRLQQGLLCRYRGHSTADVRQWFTQVWNDVRFYALGQIACPPRVWQI
jgi:urease accessory protein